MIKAFSVALLTMMVALIFMIDYASAASPNWKSLVDDYVDTDDDGEKDDYRSHDVNERFKIYDTLVDYRTMIDEGYTLLTLRSDPSHKVFFENLLDPSVMRGKGIILDVQIVADTEGDGDAMEIYDILSIYVTTDGSGKEDDDAEYNPLMSILAIAICCGPELVIPIIVVIVVIHQQKKKKAAEAKMWSEDSHEAAPQTIATAPVIPQQPVPPLHSRTGNLWNEKEVSHGQPRILEPPPDRSADKVQAATNDDMSGLDDFMKGIQSEGSDVDFVIKEDVPVRTIPKIEGDPPVVP